MGQRSGMIDGANMPRRLPLYCCEDTDRHGNIRTYFRLKGQPKTRLIGMPWTPSFMEQYETLLQTTHSDGVAGHRGKPNTWRWLCQQYFGCVEYKQLSTRTQTVRRQILEATFDEPVAPDAKATFADFPISRMSRKAVKVLRDRKVEKPEAANGRLKAIRRVFAYCLEEHEGLLSVNPARDVPFFKSNSEGFHTWTKEEVEKYLSVHEEGSKARLALFLLLYTGVRRSDLIVLGRQMVRDGWLRFQPKKTRHLSADFVEIPILPALADELAKGPQDHLNFLVTEFGKPFSPDGFGNRFRAWCLKAGLPHCSAHGLRKAGATFAAENGATESQLKAIYGWKSAKMAAIYTRKALQKKLAGSGMALISMRESGA
jgi:integrase